MKISLAIAGKGGTGKTTLSAMFVRALRETDVRPVLAVDADPNSCLAEALGVEPGRLLADIREQSSSPEGAPPGEIGRVRAVEDEVHRAIAEAEGFDLITMGQPEGPRCYCYVNTLLRKSLKDVAKNYESMVLDNEAGMEHLSRRTTDDVDFLIAVMNPTLPSFRAVRRILALADNLPINIGHRVVLVNRAGPDGAGPRFEGELAKLGAARVPDVPEDAEVEQAGAVGRDVFSLSEGNAALAAVKNVINSLRAALSPARENR
ncbi:MAG TPA: AAA family ATPase [Thermoguttaceae bacterium]|nr:AAA family ATPase [Thermoguttaceae bacterium]